MLYLDATKFGPDPTYAGLYDGPYGPSDSVLRLGDDPLALLFFFLPPKIWSQIAVESNRYHTQSIPTRARSIRRQQQRSGGEAEDLAEIRRRLSAVEEIQTYEVLQVMALLIARMLVPIRKGIAAHWSMKKVGVLPSNRFSLVMGKNRFFSYHGISTLFEQQVATSPYGPSVEDSTGARCATANIRSWIQSSPSHQLR